MLAVANCLVQNRSEKHTSFIEDMLTCQSRKSWLVSMHVTRPVELAHPIIITTNAISGFFSTIKFLLHLSSHFFCLTFASSYLFSPYFHFSLTALFSTLLHHYYTLLLSILSNPLLSRSLLFSREMGFSQGQSRAITPVLSLFYFFTSLPSSLSPSVWPWPK